MSIYKTLARIIPSKLRKRIRREILCSTIKIDPDKLIGALILWGIIISLLISVILYQLLEINHIIGFFIGLTAVFLLSYIWIMFSIDAKTKQVEEVLPDALQLMSSNIRAGLTTDKALLLAARPEFGPLAEEIKRVGRETIIGRSLESALMDMCNRVKSENLQRTVELIVNSLRSGGKLADLLDQTANDIRDQQLIQREISAGVLMYVIFIFIAIGIGAPMLFAVSSFLVEMLTTNISRISSGLPPEVVSGMPISIQVSSISSGFIRMYSLLALSLTSILGGMTMAVIRTGKVRDGFRYIVILLPLSIVIYYLISIVMVQLFGGMIRT